jgi:hypothetical protein
VKRLYAAYLPDFFATGFFAPDGSIVTVIHENDGHWRQEYFAPIARYFGGNVENLDAITLASLGLDGIEPDCHDPYDFVDEFAAYVTGLVGRRGT